MGTDIVLCIICTHILVAHYFTKTKTQNGVYIVDDDGDLSYDGVRVPNNSVRPVLKNVSTLDVGNFEYADGTRLNYFYYGEYPQKVVNKLNNSFLETLYISFSEE